MSNETSKKESLEDEVDHIIEESRMVLPGIQALFGFQLVAVFNQRFGELLPHEGQVLHLVALILVAVAIGLIMAPAAYHREAERGTISRYLANYASRLIMIAMLPLLVAISIEVALIAYAIVSAVWVSALCGIALALFFLSLWFLFPALRRRAAR
jgi:hypothetical protein